MARDGRPLRVLIQGNCHGDGLRAFLAVLIKACDANVDLRYVRNWGHEGEVVEAVGAETMAFVRSCDYYVRQMDQGTSANVIDHAPASARGIRFPAIQMNWIWPFATQPHPRNRGLAPSIPAGVYAAPLGDSALNMLMKREADPEVALQKFLARDPRKSTNLDRIYELSREKIIAIEKTCDIRYWDFIEANWRERRLFWDHGHPAWPVLQRVCREVAHWLPLGADDRQIEGMLDRFGLSRPFAEVHAPVHPKIAEHFGLVWCPPGAKFRHYNEGWFTYEEFVRRYVAFAHDDDLHIGAWHARNPGGDLAEGEKRLRAAFARNPANAECAARLAELLWKRGRPDEAIGFADVAAADPDVGQDDRVLFTRFGLLEALGRYDEALTIANRLLAMAETAAHYHHGHGRILRALGRPLDAASAFRRAAVLDPYVGRYARDAGQALLSLRRDADAAAFLAKAAELEPGDAVAWHLYAMALSRAGRRDEALEAAGRAVDLRPNSRQDLQVLAALAEDAGAHAQAEEAWRRVIRTQPAPEAAATISLAKAIEAQGRAAEALSGLVEAMSGREADAATLSAAGRLSLKVGARADAQRYFERALALAPADAQIARDLDALAAPARP